MTMILLALSIPFMLVGIAAAVLPLVLALASERRAGAIPAGSRAGVSTAPVYAPLAA